MAREKHRWWIVRMDDGTEWEFHTEQDYDLASELLCSSQTVSRMKNSRNGRFVYFNTSHITTVEDKGLKGEPYSILPYCHICYYNKPEKNRNRNKQRMLNGYVHNDITDRPNDLRPMIFEQITDSKSD